MTRQPPGACIIRPQRGGDLNVSSHVRGTFCVGFNDGGAGVVVHLNRSEFAALHAAIGELLLFYRET